MSNFPSASAITGFMQLRSHPAIVLVSAAALLTAPQLWAAADVRRPESQQEYWAHFDNRDWEVAIATAQALVTSARERAAEQPLKLAEALSLLGNAQLAKSDYISAEAAFVEALQIVEHHSGSMSANLLDPLRGLGYTLAAGGRHADAVPHLERALIIARRSYGLFDIGQQGVLRQLASSLTKTGRAAEAEKHVTYLFRVGERTYGRRDPRLVPLLCVIGNWYAETANFQQARASYRSALDIVERKLGRNDPAAIEPLRALANSFTVELIYSNMGLKTTQERQPSAADGTSSDYKALNPRYLSDDGEDALMRALAILESHPNVSRDTLTDTLIQSGDWFQIKHLPDKAMPFYRRAAASVASGGKAGATPRAPLSFPVRVYYPIPILATRNVTLPVEQVDERYVQVEFTVTGQGDVANVRVTDENGTARQVSETLQATRAARYRPKFVNGEPVETTGVTYREVFRMRKQAEGQPKES